MVICKFFERGLQSLQTLQSASDNYVWTDMATDLHKHFFWNEGNAMASVQWKFSRSRTNTPLLYLRDKLPVTLKCLAVGVLWGALNVGAAWAQTAASGGSAATGKASHAGISTTAVPTSALFVTDEWHNLTRKDGTGLYLDVVRAVFERQGVKVEYRLFPYARAVQQVKDQEADGWVASFMQEKKFPLYPKYHFDKNEQTIVFVKSKQKGAVSTATLKNQRVAWLRDFGLDRFIQEPMRVTELDSIASAFKMLASDRIDYFVGAKSDIEDHIKNNRQNMTDYGMAYALHLGLYMAFADTPRGAQLRDMWDAEMEAFHKTDAFKAIYKKYGYPYPFP